MAKLAWKLKPIDPPKDYSLSELDQIFSRVDEYKAEKHWLKPIYHKTQIGKYDRRSAKLNLFSMVTLGAFAGAVTTSYMHFGEQYNLLKFANFGLWIIGFGSAGTAWRIYKRPMFINRSDILENSTLDFHINSNRRNFDKLVHSRPSVLIRHADGAWLKFPEELWLHEDFILFLLGGERLRQSISGLKNEPLQKLYVNSDGLTQGYNAPGEHTRFSPHVMAIQKDKELLARYIELSSKSEYQDKLTAHSRPYLSTLLFMYQNWSDFQLWLNGRSRKKYSTSEFEETLRAKLGKLGKPVSLEKLNEFQAGEHKAMEKHLIKMNFIPESKLPSRDKK